MHSRRFACLVLGIWLAGGLFVGWIATENARSADRLLSDDPAVMIMLRTLGSGTGRALLTHQSSELNRNLFETWETAQLFLGIFFFAFLLLWTGERKFALGLTLLMLLLVLPQRFWLTPELSVLGRPLDFAPNRGSQADRARFTMLQSVYLGVELLKAGTGILLAAILIFQRQRRRGSGHARQELDLINKPDHRHIDR